MGTTLLLIAVLHCLEQLHDDLNWNVSTVLFHNTDPNVFASLSIEANLKFHY